MEQIYFHIGFHKTGTTWLQNKLFLNTEHFNLINNHTHPWNDELMKYIITTHTNDFEKDKLLELIKPKIKKDKINIISAERLSGHPYSAGNDIKLIAEKIYKTFPSAKIIIVTRDYDSFIISTFKQIVKEGYPGSFQQYINRNQWFFPTTPKHYFDHKNTVQLYKDLFNDQNILELNFNTFKSDKKIFLKSISKFIEKELNINITEHNHIVNKTYSNNRIRAIKFLNKFRKSEYNQYPIIILNPKLIRRISILISPFFSNKKFILDDT
ncbi:MAG: hypothetical protein CL844_06160 [Crocinitomicaceae bacterium]|nr:hypothetical protein [Crocinitomicaceae bacterium]|tara:strand:+ start:20149 stop:20952 length:804 start_codon:yes stop_codon:yes gene_type:complete